MEAYTQHFGADAGRMNLPARSAVGVAQLAAPGHAGRGRGDLRTPGVTDQGPRPVPGRRSLPRPKRKAPHAPDLPASSPCCPSPRLPPRKSVPAPGEGLTTTASLCHGTEGRGNVSINAPRIGGMEHLVHRTPLNAFREGWRGVHEDDYHGGEMRPMAVALGDGEAVAGAPPSTSPPSTVPTGRRPVEGNAAAAQGSTRPASPATAPGARATKRSARRRSPVRTTGTWSASSTTSAPASARDRRAATCSPERRWPLHGGRHRDPHRRAGDPRRRSRRYINYPRLTREPANPASSSHEWAPKRRRSPCSSAWRRRGPRREPAHGVGHGRAAAR